MGRWFCNFSFEGRARRSHIWGNYFAWTGVLFVLGMALVVVAAASGVNNGSNNVSPGGAVASLVILLALCAACVSYLIDHVAMTFRRAHDTNRTGWIWLLLLVPFVNLIGLYWLLIEDSNQGPNKYGPAVKTFYQPTLATP